MNISKESNIAGVYTIYMWWIGQGTQDKETRSIIKIIIFIVIITSSMSEKRKKVIHTEANILASAQRSSSQGSLLVLQLKTKQGLTYLSNQRKGRKHKRGEFCLPRCHQSWAWIYSHRVFVRNDGIYRKLGSKKKEKYQAKPRYQGHLLLRTSSAGFHHISTNITLLQAVKLRPTSQTNNETSSLP